VGYLSRVAGKGAGGKGGQEGGREGGKEGAGAEEGGQGEVRQESDVGGWKSWTNKDLKDHA